MDKYAIQHERLDLKDALASLYEIEVVIPTRARPAFDELVELLKQEITKLKLMEDNPKQRGKEQNTR